MIGNKTATIAVLLALSAPTLSWAGSCKILLNPNQADAIMEALKQDGGVIIDLTPVLTDIQIDEVYGATNQDPEGVLTTVLERSNNGKDGFNFINHWGLSFEVISHLSEYFVSLQKITGLKVGAVVLSNEAKFVAGHSHERRQGFLANVALINHGTYFVTPDNVRHEADQNQTLLFAERTFHGSRTTSGRRLLLSVELHQ